MLSVGKTEPATKKTVVKMSTNDAYEVYETDGSTAYDATGRGKVTPEAYHTTFRKSRTFRSLFAFRARLEVGLMWLWERMSGSLAVDEDREKVMRDQASTRLIMRRTALKWLTSRQQKKDIVFSGAMFLLMMLNYFYITYEQKQVRDAFALEYAVKHYMERIEYIEPEECEGNIIDDVKDYETLWLWLEQGYLPALFPEQEWYNGDEFSEEEQGYFLEYNRLIGGFKMVQSRVKSCECGDNSTLTSDEKADCGCPAWFSSFYPVVYPNLKPETESKEAFGPEWDPGKYEYDTNYGGHTIIIPPSQKLAEKTLAELKNDLWIDKGTRKLSLTFNAYNGNVRMFTVFKLTFDFGATGKLVYLFRAQTFRLEYYSTSGDKFRGFLEAVLLFYTFCSFLSELQELYQKKVGESHRRLRLKEYFSDAGNQIDLLRILLFLIAAWSWLHVLYHPVAREMELPLDKHIYYYDMDTLANLHKQNTRLQSVLIFVCMITTFKYMSVSPVYGIVVRTVIKAGPSLFQFFVMFTITCYTFAVMGVLLFGHIIYEFSDVPRACKTLVMLITTELGMEEMNKADRIFGPIYYSLFITIVFFLLVNILLAILMNAYSSLAQENINEQKNQEINLSINVLREYWLQFKSSIQTMICKILHLEFVPYFISNEEMVRLLVEDQTLLEEATKVPVRPTMSEPNPDPIILITYAQLLERISATRANLMMMAIGMEPSDVDDAIWKIQNRGQKKKRVGGNQAAVTLAPTFQRNRTESTMEDIGHDSATDARRRRPSCVMEPDDHDLPIKVNEHLSAIDVDKHDFTDTRAYHPPHIDIYRHSPNSEDNAQLPSPIELKEYRPTLNVEDSGIIQVTQFSGMLPPPRTISEESAYEAEQHFMDDAPTTKKNSQENFEEEVWMTQWKFEHNVQ